MAAPTDFLNITDLPEAADLTDLFLAAESSDPSEPTKKIPLSMIAEESSKIANAGDSHLAGGNIWPAGNRDVEAGDKLLNITLIKVSEGGVRKLYRFASPVSGTVTAVGAATSKVIVGVDGVPHTLFKNDIYNDDGSINAKEFGLLGDVAISDFLELGDYISTLTANDSLELKFPSAINLTSKGTALAFGNIKKFKCVGLVVTDANIYSGAFDITRIFDINDIDDVELNYNATSTLIAVGGDKQGLTVCRLDTAKSLKATGSTTKCYQGIEHKNVELVDINTVNNDTRYPLLSVGGNGIINANMVNNGCRRDFFVQDGCKGGVITVDSTDLEEGCIIAHYVSSNSSDLKTCNLDVKYTYKSTGRYDSTRGDRSPPISVTVDTASGVTAGKSEVRDVNIHYNSAGDKWGGVVGLRKTIDNFNPDTKGRGYIITNLNLSGRIELGSDNNCVYFNYNTGKNWFSGDQIGGLYLDKLTVLDRSPAQIEFNANIILDAVSPGGIVVIDHAAPSVVIDNSVNFEDKVIFKRCTFLKYTTRDTQPLSRATLFRKDWAKIDNGSLVIAKVDPYRTITSVNIYINTYTPAASVTDAVSGEFVGNITYPTSPVFGYDGKFRKDFSKGSTLTPALTGDSSGNITLSIPELSGVTGAQVCIDASLCYNQYSAGDNENIRGMVSKKFELLF